MLVPADDLLQLPQERGSIVYRGYGPRTRLGQFLDANKTRKNERQRRRADNNPQRQSLQQRPKADVRKRLSVEPGSDQEQRHGKAYSAKLIEPCEHRVKSRQQRIQERR